MTENQRIRLCLFTQNQATRKFTQKADTADPKKGGSHHDHFFQSYQIFVLTCIGRLLTARVQDSTDRVKKSSKKFRKKHPPSLIVNSTNINIEKCVLVAGPCGPGCNCINTFGSAGF